MDDACSGRSVDPKAREKGVVNNFSTAEPPEKAKNCGCRYSSASPQLRESAEHEEESARHDITENDGLAS